MQFKFEYETETGKGTVTTLPVDICVAEEAMNATIMEDMSFRMITRIVHSALARKAKRGEADPLPPYAGWLPTLLAVKQVEADSPNSEADGLSDPPPAVSAG